MLTPILVFKFIVAALLGVVVGLVGAVVVLLVVGVLAARALAYWL